LDLRYVAIDVLVLVVALKLSLPMVRPVLVEVVGLTQGSEPENGFCATETPQARLRPATDEVAAGFLDDASGDGKPLGEVSVVPEEVAVLEQVVRAGIATKRGLDKKTRKPV